MGDELVECHSGYEYAERPVALRWQDERLAIKQIEGEWRIPGGKRFQVQTVDDRIFELIYQEPDDEWFVKAL